MSKKITYIFFYWKIVFPLEKKVDSAHLGKDLGSKLRAAVISQSNLFSSIFFNIYDIWECNLPKESVQVMKDGPTAFLFIPKTANSLLIVGR